MLKIRFLLINVTSLLLPMEIVIDTKDLADKIYYADCCNNVGPGFVIFKQLYLKENFDQNI